MLSKPYYKLLILQNIHHGVSTYLDKINTGQTGHCLNSDGSSEAPYFLQRFDLSMHLKLNSGTHGLEFLVGLFVGEIASGLFKTNQGLFNFAVLDQMSRRIGNLYAQGQTPLCRTIGSIGASQADPFGHHSS
ncbi:Uncharacterized protein HZ326_29728 [Fusarium oxysporum f. sp. albedinis]|nr:Uncharacterized protein HZ326_29728 [Fusarium oxysporum f. sp. albedinis]